MNIEPITRDNIEAVWQLYTRSIAACDRLPLDCFDRQILDDPAFDPELALVMMENGSPVSLMDCLCRQTKNGLVGHIKTFCTAPEFRGQGICTTLLEHVEVRLRACEVNRLLVGCSAPYYINPGIDPQAYTPGVAFLQRRGFKYQNMYYNMDVPLVNHDFIDPVAENRILGQDITVRRVTTAEMPEVLSSMQSYGWPENWQKEVRAASAVEPAAVFIDVRDGHVLGFAAYDANRPAYFGPMGTSLSARGSGIGGALFMRCLADMQSRGYEVCHISAVGPLYFYWKTAGATVSRCFWEMSKELS